MFSKHSLEGFTLAELLVALAILGVIATFTVPKILATSQNQQKKAVFRETISAISEAISTGTMSNRLDRNSNFYAHIANKLNAVKFCPNNASTEGCWLNSSWVGEENEPGFVMHNGVSVAGLRTTTAGFDNIVIDWNGPAAPNTEGEDRVFLAVCWDRTDSSYTTYCSRPSQQGYVEPGPIAGPASHTMWAWIFQ